MTVTLQRLIAEARVLAGGAHECAVLDHDWRSQGGRRCPRLLDAHESPCSQTVYVCRACGDTDYGDAGGPGFRDCFIKGPCSTGCTPDIDT
jgi:hypothetical protein